MADGACTGTAIFAGCMAHLTAEESIIAAAVGRAGPWARWPLMGGDGGVGMASEGAPANFHYSRAGRVISAGVDGGGADGADGRWWCSSLALRRLQSQIRNEIRRQGFLYRAQLIASPSPAHRQPFIHHRDRPSPAHRQPFTARHSPPWPLSTNTHRRSAAEPA